jgi:hypothetical protein
MASLHKHVNILFPKIMASLCVTSYSVAENKQTLVGGGGP